MSTGHIVEPEIVSRLMGQLIEFGYLFQTKVGAAGRDTVVDLHQVQAVQKNMADEAVLFLPGGNWLPIREPFEQFVAFWNVWKRRQA